MAAFIMGISLFVSGFVLRYAPPKKISGIFGYRTDRSMRSQEAWDFAQRYSGKILILASGVFIALYLILTYLADFDTSEGMFIYLPLIIASFGVVFWLVERELKKRYD
jgi:uncharacterized membrane protein